MWGDSGGFSTNQSKQWRHGEHSYTWFSFHRLYAWFGAVIIVDFYIDDFIFALFIIFTTYGKTFNNNGSEIIGLINVKFGKRTACRDNFFLLWMRDFHEKQGKGQQRGTNLNLLNVCQSFCPKPYLHAKVWDTEEITKSCRRLWNPWRAMTWISKTIKTRLE